MQLIPNRGGHEYPRTAIEVLATDIGSLAALSEIVPTLDSNDLIGGNAGTSQKLLDYGAARFSQCARASLRPSRVTETDNQNSRLAVLSQPIGRLFQHVPPCASQFKAVRCELDRVPEKRRIGDCRGTRLGNSTGGLGTVDFGSLLPAGKRSRRRRTRHLSCREHCLQN